MKQILPKDPLHLTAPKLVAVSPSDHQLVLIIFIAMHGVLTFKTELKCFSSVNRRQHRDVQSREVGAVLLLAVADVFVILDGGAVVTVVLSQAE